MHVGGACKMRDSAKTKFTPVYHPLSDNVPFKNQENYTLE